MCTTGMHYGPDPKLERPPAAIEKLLATNTLSHFWTLKAFLPAMIERDHGHVLTIGSAAGVIGVAGMLDYCASKFALRGMNEALRMQLLRQGSAVRCTMVSPSYIDTGMFEGVRTSMADGARLGAIFLPLLRPALVARRALTAAKRGAVEVQLPAMVYTSDVLRGILPSWAFDLVARSLGISQALDDFQQTRQHDVNVARL
jgi:all-trans-retinol dehydrogenase (NAD+)|eukprot:COSAG01_NODE_4092_length_5356_cov_137.323378_5_plen_201_part_00